MPGIVQLAIAAALAYAVARGTWASIYIWGLYREERRYRGTGLHPTRPVRRLLRWLAWLTTGMAAAGYYFAGLLAWRLTTSEPSPIWLAPVSAATIIGLLLSGDYIASRLRRLEREGQREPNLHDDSA